MKLTDSQCLVIKIGSSLLVDEEKGRVNMPWLASLIADVAELYASGMKVVIVSSGAMAYGKIALELTDKNLSLDHKQAISAVGQIQLTHDYQQLLQQYNIKAAQVLLTLDDTENRLRYINLRNTLKKLLELGVIPIINENDSITTMEIRYGDNDRLAARVAQMVDADTLVLLSDIDGLYTDDPRFNKDAKLIPEIKSLTTDILAMAKDSGSNYGSGGMITKLQAAKIALSSGCRMLITKGKKSNPLRNHIQTNIGTWFVPTETPKGAKKIWLEQHLKAKGSIVVDSGAENALLKGASLLPVGMTKVNGSFEKGSALQILNQNDEEIARGLCNYSSQDCQILIGKKTTQIGPLLGYDGCHEIIHRDNLALTKGITR